MEDKYYYSYCFEDDNHIKNKDFYIVIEYNEMAVKDGQLLFNNNTRESITPDYIDMSFLDKITHVSFFDIEEFMDFHYIKFTEGKLDWLSHTEKLLKKSLLFVEMNIEIQKSPHYEAKFNLPGDEPAKYLTYHKVAYEWVINKKEEELSINNFNLSTPPIYKILNDYQPALTSYLDAVKKIELGLFERNILDDLRLTLELYLKGILNNTKSLENQLSEISNIQKQSGTPSEISNMFHKLLDLFSKYQNNNIKHGNNARKADIELIHNLTILFIEYINNSEI